MCWLQYGKRCWYLHEVKFLSYASLETDQFKKKTYFVIRDIYGNLLNHVETKVIIQHWFNISTVFVNK